MERRRPVAAQVLACVAVLSLVPGSAGAEPRSSPATATLAWPTYSFSTFEYVATATFTAVAIDTALVSPRPGHLRGGVLFDDGARNALRASDAGTRKAIRTVDDVIVGSAVGFPFLVDAVLTAAIVRRSPNVAKEMTLIDADTLGLTAALHGLTSFLVSRERPGARTCDSATLGDKSQCGAGRYRASSAPMRLSPLRAPD